MKSKITIAFLSVFMLLGSFSYASFPVERETVVSINAETLVEETTIVLSSPAAVVWQESQTIALLLWFFLGGFAAHRWYLGSPWYWNVLFILTLGFFFVGYIIDLVEIITGTYPGL